MQKFTFIIYKMPFSVYHITMTITDIAARAGVSIATVSRFMNNGSVKEETRKKLEQVIQEMNYQPNNAIQKAVPLSPKKESIAILTHSISNLYSSEFAEEVTSQYSKNGVMCYTICCTNMDEEYRSIMDMVSRGFTGAVLHDLAEGEALANLYNRIGQKFPLVIVHSYPVDLECNSITVNQEKGMRDAMAYLLKLGHRKIAYVSGDTGYSFKIKEKIWKEELEKVGCTPEKQDAIKAENTDFEAGVETTHQAVLKYLQDGNRPTAIFTANDIMALGTIAAMSDMGLKVGEDISLMSHDNTMIAKSYNLTCVDMKIRSVGIAAVDLMNYALHGSDSTPRHITISPAIIERTSCRRV